MATSVTTSLPFWLAGGTYDANGASDLRNSGVTAYFFNEGIITGSTIGVLGGVIGGAGLLVNNGTGMTVTVQAGSYVVPNTASAIAGGYVSTLAQLATLTVATADPVNPRIDIVCANVVDNGNNTSFGEVQIITGTPAGSPVAPSAPANSITLAQVSVPANTTSITSGLITDTRPYTVATGGVLKAPKGNVTGYNGQLAFDPASGSFYHNTNLGGPKQAKVLPWAPQMARYTSNTQLGGPSFAPPPLASLTISTDGNTDIKITYHIPGIEMPVIAASQVQFSIAIDSTQVDETDIIITSSDLAGISGHGFTGIYHTSAAAGDTPSAGSHTVFLSGSSTVAAATYATAGAGRHGYLRVEPVSL